MGVISFGTSLNSFDDFKCHDLAGPYEVDGRYFAEVGDVQVDASNSNELKIDSTVSQNVPVVRRGFRADTFVATFKFYWSTPCRPGQFESVLKGWSEDGGPTIQSGVSSRRTAWIFMMKYLGNAASLGQVVRSQPRSRRS